MPHTARMRASRKLSGAFAFVLLIGVLSFFADFAYEGARSITGPFLGVLGATGAIVSIVAGLGEFLGYGLRLLSGPLAERTGRLWPITIFGYVLQMTAVPLLALAGNWETAAALILLERIGKAIRNPPRDVMLSYAARDIGYGWGFGVHEALDQFGALCGPSASRWSARVTPRLSRGIRGARHPRADHARAARGRTIHLSIAPRYRAPRPPHPRITSDFRRPSGSILSARCSSRPVLPTSRSSRFTFRTGLSIKAKHGCRFSTR